MLLAVIQVAADTGHHTHAWQFPHMLVPFFERQGHWHDFAAAHRIALTATEDHADRQGQAHAHLGIGEAWGGLAAPRTPAPSCRTHCACSKNSATSRPVRRHFYLGITFHKQEQNREALAHMQQAVDLALAHGDFRRGLAAALNGLGWVHAVLGNAEEAIDYSQDSFGLFRELGDRWGEAATLDTIGYAHHHLGDHQLAATYFERALEIDGELGDPYSEAIDADHLGDALHAVGNTTQARSNWQLALNILVQLSDLPRIGAGYADPDAIRAKLRSTGS